MYDRGTAPSSLPGWAPVGDGAGIIRDLFLTVPGTVWRFSRHLPGGRIPGIVPEQGISGMVLPEGSYRCTPDLGYFLHGSRFPTGEVSPGL